MGISGVSSPMAISTQLSVAIAKIGKESIEQQGEGILKMLDSIPDASSGSNIDISI